MHLLYWLMFILLHRPLFNRKAQPVYISEREIDHKKLCERAAENILLILQAWRTLYTLRYVPVTLLQAVFSAGTVVSPHGRDVTGRSRVVYSIPE